MQVNSCYAWNSKTTKRNNSNLFPSSIRGLIIGKSNCGKTTLLLNCTIKTRCGWITITCMYLVKAYIRPNIKLSRQDSSMDCRKSKLLIFLRTKNNSIRKIGCY